MSGDSTPNPDEKDISVPLDSSSPIEPNPSGRVYENDIPLVRRNVRLIQLGRKQGLISSEYADWMLKQEIDWESNPIHEYNAEYDIALQKLFKRTNAPASASPIYQKAHLRIPRGIEVYSVEDAAHYHTNETMPLSDSRWIAARSRNSGGYREVVSFVKGAGPMRLGRMMDNGSLERQIRGKPLLAFEANLNLNVTISFTSLLNTTSTQVETLLKKIAVEDFTAYGKARQWWQQTKLLLGSWPTNQRPRDDFNPELDLATAVDRVLYPLVESRRALIQRINLELTRLGENDNPSKADRARRSKLSELKSKLTSDFTFIFEEQTFVPLNQEAGKLLGGGRGGFLSRFKKLGG